LTKVTRDTFLLEGNYHFLVQLELHVIKTEKRVTVCPRPLLVTQPISYVKQKNCLVFHELHGATFDRINVIFMNISGQSMVSIPVCTSLGM